MGMLRIFTGLLVLGVGLNLWAAESIISAKSYESLYTDKRSIGLGKTITVLIMETSSASTANANSSSRDLNVSGNYATDNSTGNGSVGLGLDRSVDDGSSRSGNFTAAITAEITNKWTTGKLYIEGNQTLIVDGDEQKIFVSGWLRPEDITSDNTVISSRLSNARIEYKGYDVDGDGEKRGWWYRMWSFMGFI